MCGLAMSVSSDLATLKDHVLSGYAKVLKKTGAEQRTYWKGYVVKFVWACSVWNDEVQVERSSHKQKLLHRHVCVWKQCYLLAYRVCSLIISLQIDVFSSVTWKGRAKCRPVSYDSQFQTLLHLQLPFFPVCH